MDADSLRHFAIHGILHGLRKGVSRFSAPVRVALLIAPNRMGPLLVYDPHELLLDHRVSLKAEFLDSTAWRDQAPDMTGWERMMIAMLTGGPDLPGLISFGIRSASAFFLLWLVESPPNLCSRGPIERWLQHAAWLLCFSTPSWQSAIGTKPPRPP